MEQQRQQDSFLSNVSIAATACGGGRMRQADPPFVRDLATGMDRLVHLDGEWLLTAAEDAG